MGQLQIAPGGGVNLDGALFAFFLRWAQKGEFALLGQIKILNQCAHGGHFCALEGAKSIQSGDVEEIAEAFLCPRTVKS